MLLQEKKNEVRKWFVHLGLYTILWFMLILGLILIFKIKNRVFLWSPDGVYQHYASFNYLCDYLNSMLEKHQLLSIFNFSLGQGLDVITTLGPYDFTDPISIIAALVFPLSRLQRYSLMIIIKLYLIGLSFALYCDAVNYKNKTAVILASIAYTFSGAVLFTLIRHPNYINWAYFFPFLLSGVEFYIRKGTRIPLVVFIFLNIVTSYYTFYINAILVVICVVVKSVCHVVQIKSVVALKAELLKGGRIAIVFLVGILLSSCVLFPTVFAFANNSRVGVATGYTDSLWHYGWGYYGKLFESIFAAFYSPGYVSYLGINAILIIPFVMLFTYKGRGTFLKAMLVICFIMLCLPVAGRLMNGFGYASNRWSFVIPFFMSISLVEMSDKMESIPTKKAALVYIVIIIYIAICLLNKFTSTNMKKYYAVLIILVDIVVWGTAVQFKTPHIKALLTLLVFAGASFQIINTFSFAGNYVVQHLHRNKADSCFTDFSSNAALNMEEDFYRVEMSEGNQVQGYSPVNGTTLWWSMIPSSIYNYYRELGLDTVVQNCSFRGLSGRTGLLELASVKYYTRPAAKEGLIPYGYVEIKSPNTRYQVFKNTNALPIGYTYSGYISRAEYDNLNALEKEQALLQAAVLEDQPESYEKAEPERLMTSLKYTVQETSGVQLANKRMDITEAGGTVTFAVDVPEGHEIYLYFDNIQLLGNTSDVNFTATRENSDFSVSKTGRISNTHYSWPVIRDDVAVNLGCGYDGENTVTLKVSKIATFAVDNILIYAVPMSLYENAAADLGKYVLENVVVGADHVTGTIHVPEKRILQFSIPYSKGWRAYVDGREVDIVASDVMYMAVFLDAGEHTVELRYMTPYLKEGILVSGITLFCWVGYEVMQSKKKANYNGFSSAKKV